MNLLLMANFSNPRFHSVWQFLSSRGHQVDITEDHREMDLTKYDVGVAFYYRVIVSQKDLETFRYGVINNHPGKLPEVRGAFTNIWPIAFGVPCGVTVQLMEAGLDTGPIISEREVEILDTDTGDMLWHRLVEAQHDLFCRYWPIIERDLPRGNLVMHKQVGEPKTWKMSDVKEIDNLTETYGVLAHDILDRIRARSHYEYDGCYIVRDGRKIGVRVELDDLGPA